jgi:phosphoribosylformimino-5-aminoimidazole carboxamide ribotide isomerase
VEIIPAIDIRGGRCVRLFQGRYDRETVFDSDPVDAARRWIDAGATRLHVVDLDGARSGDPVNLPHVARIAGLGPPVQCGGGVRDAARAGRLLDAGVDRVILGTAAVHDAALVEALCRDHPGAIVASLDARDGFVATDGWTRTSRVRAAELATALQELGVPRFVYTDISRDGAMTEPNTAALGALVEVVGVPVIASGGVAAPEHVAGLAVAGAEAAIIGRALYAGALTLSGAMAAAASATAGAGARKAGDA